jgi:hypothetical protein
MRTKSEQLVNCRGSESPMSNDCELYDEMLLLTSATKPPRLFYKVSSKGWRQVQLTEVGELAPDDLETFTAFYEVTGVLDESFEVC